MILFKTVKNKIEHLVRLILVNTRTISNDSVLIVEYPKSGGTWLGQLISNYLEIPFPRNKFPTFKRALFHSHYLPKWNIPKNKKIVFLVRDGRDVLISLYYHQLLWNDKNKLSPKDIIYHRKKTGYADFEDVKSNMNDFIEYTFLQKSSKLRQFTYMGNWYTYNKAWLAEMNKNTGNIYLITYEELLEDTYGAMDRMLHNFFGVKNIDEKKLKHIVDKFSFENQTKRKKGDENKSSFLRKGIAGDWENYFGNNEKDTFKKYTNNMLIDLGYEENDNW